MVKRSTARRSSRLSIDDLSGAVRRGDVRNCYLFAGEEQFIADEAVTLLCDALIPDDERSFNLDIIFGNDVQAHEVTAIASSYPMMGERRLVIVRDADRIGKLDALTSYIKDPLESTVLVLICESPDFRRNPFRAFSDDSVLECRPLYDNQIPQWIGNRIKRAGKTIAPEAATLLAGYTGTSLRQVSNELEKLDIYTANRPVITADDVTAVVGVTKAFNIFELQKAVGHMDVSAAVHILDRMIDRGESPVFIITMLTRFFRHLATVADLRTRNATNAAIAQEIRVHPYFLDEYFSHLHHHTPDRFADRFRALLQADTDLKTTGKNPRLVLSVLLYQLMDKESIGTLAFGEDDEPITT
jgi:DNA polymerase III subunit delta